MTTHLTHRRNLALTLACAAGVAGVAGCASSGGAETAEGAEGEAKQLFKGDPPPADAEFARLEYGMGLREVTDVVGQWDDQCGYVSGKAWNPFYYGTDRTRTAYIYEGQGILHFNNRQRLVVAEYDPDEDGYR